MTGDGLGIIPGVTVTQNDGDVTTVPAVPPSSLTPAGLTQGPTTASLNQTVSYFSFFFFVFKIISLYFTSRSAIESKTSESYPRAECESEPNIELF